jgi:hypothetical protein
VGQDRILRAGSQPALPRPFRKNAWISLIRIKDAPLRPCNLSFLHPNQLFPLSTYPELFPAFFILKLPGGSPPAFSDLN